jgi:hypothetical protein
MDGSSCRGEEGKGEEERSEYMHCNFIDIRRVRE